MIEDEFGGSPSPMSKTIAFHASAAGGKHAEQRILKRVVKDAKKEAAALQDPYRAVGLVVDIAECNEMVVVTAFFCCSADYS